MTRRHKLTSRQRVIRYIVKFANTYSYPPTMAEIAAGLGFNSVEAVRYHLRVLRAAGTIEWLEGPTRSIRLRETS